MVEKLGFNTPLMPHVEAKQFTRRDDLAWKKQTNMYKLNRYVLEWYCKHIANSLTVFIPEKEI